MGPIAGEPTWLTKLASYLPAQPMVDAATRALQHGSGSPLGSTHDAVVLAGWAAAGLLASLALFRWEPKRPTQRRRLPRDGHERDR